MGFYSILLIIVHLVISLKRIIFRYLCNLTNPLCVTFRKYSAEQLRDDAKTLNKLPIHLGILVTEDRISFSDIANIIVWSLTMDISCVSVYDIHGICKGNKSILQHEIYKKQKEVEGSKYTDCQLMISNCDEDIHNGYIKPGKSHIKLFSLEDGRKSLADVTQQLSKSVVKKESRIADITPSKVDSILKENLGCQDPDLVLRFGLTDSLIGYIPWQMRLAEILSFPTHHKLDYKTFRLLLDAFGNTQQRVERLESFCAEPIKFFPIGQMNWRKSALDTVPILELYNEHLQRTTCSKAHDKPMEDIKPRGHLSLLECMMWPPDEEIPSKFCEKKVESVKLEV